MTQIAFNQDCMEAMREMPDKAFELAIVDPPYSHNSGNAFTSRLKKYGQLEYNNEKPSPKYFKELVRVSQNQIIWGGNYFVEWLENTKCMIAWWKHQPVKTYATIEIAWTSFQDEHANIFDYPYYGFVNRDPSREHPNQKPVALYEWLLRNYAKAGDKILDTHLGSGSSRIAAYNLGFDFVGYEIDKDYFDAQEERFNAHISQVRLLDVAQPVYEQDNLFGGGL